MDNKKNTRNIGNIYEELATNYLVDNGYRILDRNFKLGRNNEIDIVAKDEKTVVFVEVKYRSVITAGYPVESVNYQKQRKICMAAKRYICFKKLPLDIPYRFDVIGIYNNKIEHIKNAFLYVE